MSTKDRTVTLSLRISEVAYKALQEDAKKLNASLNTIANQILLAHALYDRHFKKYGLVKVSSPLFTTILDAATDEAIVQAGKSAATGVLQSVIISATGELSVDSILDWLKRVGTYSNLNDYSEISHGGKTSVTMAHRFGPKGSRFFASYADSLFKSVGKPIKITTLEDSVTFEV